MKSIRYDQVVILHNKLISKTGGMTGIKDSGLIKSALERHKATFDGIDLYPSTLEKISVTTVSLVSNHGFVDGNKRIGVTALLLLLKLNNYVLEYTQNELINLGLSLAKGHVKEKELLQWINNHLK
jgi:death-on-curing protein